MNTSLMGWLLVACSLTVGTGPAAADTVTRFGLQLERGLPRPPLPSSHEWRALNGTDIANFLPGPPPARSPASAGATLELSALGGAGGRLTPEPMALLEAWLAALAARDDLWLARVRDVVAGPSTGAGSGRPPDETARQHERARKVFDDRWGELDMLAGPLGPRRLPFVQLQELLVRDPADQTGTRDFLLEGLIRIDRARERLADAVRQQAQGGAQDDVGLAMVELVSAWRTTYRVAYAQVIRQARLDARTSGTAPLHLPGELFGPEAPRF